MAKHPASRLLQISLAVCLFFFLNQIDTTQARERHRLIVPQPIKTVHRTHQTQYARAYGYESQLKHLKAVAPIAQAHKLGIKSRVGPPFPGTQPSRPRPLRSHITKKGPNHGQATRGDPQLYKRPGPAPGLKRIPPRHNVLPTPKLPQYKPTESLEQYNTPNFQEQPSKFQKHLYGVNENGDGYTGGGAGLSTSYQNVQSHLGSNHLNTNTKYPKYRQSNRIPYVEETNEDEAVDDYDEPETHRLSASQNRGAYRKPPAAHLKEPSHGYEVQEYGGNHHHRYNQQKENLYALPQQLHRPTDDNRSSRPSSSASSSSSSLPSADVDSAYKTAYQAFSYRKLRTNPNTAQNYQSQAQRGEYSGVNSYGDTVNFGQQRNPNYNNSNNHNHNNNNSNNNKDAKDGDHDIGFGEGLV